ncbi:GNAT family N-acetyltransferase [Azotobacter vinelandii]|uniref:GNAT family N-acetyltransferase n=1 Tax=Azotobacter vinelandii TaxID=354 RepID=UPI0009E96BFB|nr:GNAT family N-acetyltransferase [Azotobacter vinelandii]
MESTTTIQSHPEIKLQITLKEECKDQGVLSIESFAPIHYQYTLDRVIIHSLPSTLPATALLPLLASQFCQNSKLDIVHLQTPISLDFAHSAIRQGIFDKLTVDKFSHQILSCRRQTFWQNSLMWLPTTASIHTPLNYMFTGEKRHPVRPPVISGEVYRRYLPRLKSTFSLRTIDPGVDLTSFNRWMNLEQVAFFWDQAGSLEEHEVYLHELLQDPRVHPLIGCFDNEPFAYFEVYWCKEDRIAPFYDVQDYDRGWHVVIGESKHQSAGKLKAWFQSLMHYIFLDDPRTQRILGEPRLDHSRQIDFLKSQGYGHLKDIQLPHKQAALLRLERETFFDSHHL